MKISNKIYTEKSVKNISNKWRYQHKIYDSVCDMRNFLAVKTSRKCNLILVIINKHPFFNKILFKK